jgi:hypothetical protein
MDHEGEDAHLSGTAVVQFDGTLLELLFFRKAIPSEVNGVVAEVTNVFTSSGDVLHDGRLKDTDEEKELDKSTGRDGLEGSETVGDISELGSRKVNASWKTDTGLLDKVSNNGKHGDTAVLQFNESEAVELLLVAIGDKAEGIEKSERGLGTELILEGAKSSALGSLLGRGESGGGGDKGGKNSGLHVEIIDGRIL